MILIVKKRSTLSDTRSIHPTFAANMQSHPRAAYKPASTRQEGRHQGHRGTLSRKVPDPWICRSPWYPESKHRFRGAVTDSASLTMALSREEFQVPLTNPLPHPVSLREAASGQVHTFTDIHSSIHSFRHLLLSISTQGSQLDSVNTTGNRTDKIPTLISGGGEWDGRGTGE